MASLPPLGLSRLASTLVQLSRFAVFGAMGAGTNLAVYTVLLGLGMSYVPASFAGWLAGLGLVFVLNRRYTFRSTGSVLGELGRTVLVYLGQQVLVVVVLIAFVEGVGMSPVMAYFAVLPFAVAFSFVGLKFVAMRG